jgi:hypothetical protein
MAMPKVCSMMGSTDWGRPGDSRVDTARLQAAAASIVATETPTVRAGDSRPASRADTAEPAIIASTVGMKNQPKPVSGSPRCWIRNTGADST